MVDQRIVKTPGVCGGRARINGLRLPVWEIVYSLKEGQTKEEILDGFPSLAQEDIDAAIGYYKNYQSEVDQDYEENQV